MFDLFPDSSLYGRSENKVAVVNIDKEKSGTGAKSEGLMSLKTDIVFKRIFGIESHKRVLVCLLNAILNGKPYIKVGRI